MVIPQVRDSSLGRDLGDGAKQGDSAFPQTKLLLVPLTAASDDEQGDDTQAKDKEHHAVLLLESILPVFEELLPVLAEQGATVIGSRCGARKKQHDEQSKTKQAEARSHR